MRYDNGFVPVASIYPEANERIYELFTRRHNAMTEIMRGLRANRLSEAIGFEPVSGFDEEELEAAGALEAVRDELGSPESLSEIFAPILKAYKDSADEGPVDPCDMRDLSEFDS